MVNNRKELLHRIRLGEDSSIEFKTVVFERGKIHGPSRKKLANEIASLANSQGGTLILGVDDTTREIVGIPLEYLDDVERYVFEICDDSIIPPVIFTSSRMEIPDSSGILRIILKIDIPRSLFIHESPGGYFHRSGSSVRKMRPEYLARMFQQRSRAGLFRFEEQSVPESSVADLSQKLWQRYITSSGESTEVVLEKRSLLVKEENGDLTASVAGILFCCQQPERFLPNAYIEAVRYRGTKQNSNYQIDAHRIRGPVYRQIKEAMTFLTKNQIVGAVKTPHRIEKPQFNEHAVFEAIVNAVAHRDYSIHGSKIRFFMFDDRLEIYSPGSLPNSVNIENMRLRQSTRNELICNLLSETSVSKAIKNINRNYYMEKRGDGVPIIIDESEKHSGCKPVYKLIDDAELLLIIYSANTPNIN